MDPERASGEPLSFKEVEAYLELAGQDSSLRRLLGGLRSIQVHKRSGNLRGSRSDWMWRHMANRVIRRRQPPSWDGARLLVFLDTDHPGMRNIMPILEATDRAGLPIQVLLLDYFFRERKSAFDRLGSTQSASMDAVLACVPVSALPAMARQGRRDLRDLLERLPEGPIRAALKADPRYFASRIADQILYERALDAWLDKAHCTGILALGFQDGVPLALLETARRKGIPTVAPVHGALVAFHELFSPPYHPDVFLSWGPAWRRWFGAAERGGARLVDVGFARFDSLQRAARSATVQAFLDACNVQNPVMYLSDDLWVDTYDREEVKALHARLRDALAPLAQRGAVLLKLHPAGNPEFQAMQDCWAAADLARCAVVRDEYRLQELFPHVRAVVGGITTGLLEAMVCGVPVVQLAERDPRVGWDLGRENCLRVQRMEELPAVLHRLDEDSVYRAEVLAAQARYVEKALVNHGRAAEVTAQFLAQLHTKGLRGVWPWFAPAAVGSSRAARDNPSASTLGA